MKTGTKEGINAVTHYAVKERFDGYDLVKIDLETGRMHQIRAHFESIGHPLIGDSRYGDFSLNREFKKNFGLKRLFLHSARLDFEWHGEKIGIDSALPLELKCVIKELRNLRKKSAPKNPTRK